MKRSILFIIVSTLTVVIFTATPKTAFAQGSPAIQLASNGGNVTTSKSADDVCEQRLLKALDGLDKAEKALGFAQSEIQSRIALDALKDQYIAVLKEMNQQLMDLNKNLVKGTVKSKLKKFLETAEKIGLIALGVYLGHL